MGAVLLKSRLYAEAEWQPHTAQEEVLRCDARSKIVSAGRRFGKSELGAYDRLLPEAFLTYSNRAEIAASGKRWEYWIVGPEYTDGEKEFRKLYNAMRKLGIPFDAKGSVPEGIGTRYNVESGDMSISLWGGLFYVVVKSAKYPASLVGEGLRGVVLSEAAKLKPSIYDKYIRPTLADYRGWLLATSTPEGKNWFYEMWQRGQDPNRPEWASWRLPAWQNPYVYPDGGSWEVVDRIRDDRKHGLSVSATDYPEIDPEIFDLLIDMTPERFNQEVGADFAEFVGRVFKDWDEEIHVRDLEWNPNPRWFTCAATDYGFTNPSVWLLIQVDTWGNVYVLREYYERGKTIEEMTQDIQADPGLCPPSCRTLFGDPEDPGSSKYLSQHLKLKVRAGTGGLVRDRIDLIRMALKRVPAHLPNSHPEKQPKLFVDRSCVHTIREMDAYRYAENKREQDANNPENPLKKDDHVPEALGRFFMGHFGVGSLVQNRSRITTADMSGRR